MCKADDITLTQAELVELFDYREGQLYWRVKGSGRVLTKPAGRINSKGHRQIGINGRLYQAHRLIWIYVYGSIDKDLVIDHANGHRDDNRIENLRLVSQRKNNSNKYSHRAGRLVGCYFNKPNKKWQAQIMINGKLHYIGCYPTEAEAHAAYLARLSRLAV